MEKRKKEEEKPKLELGLDLGGIFKGIGELVELASKLAEEGQAEIKRTGEITFDKAKKLRGMYGFSVRVGRGGKPIIDKFGTLVPEARPKELKPEVSEVREPLVDVFEEKEEIIIVAELPGVEEKDIKTELKEDILIISGETKDRKYLKEVALPAKVTGALEKSYRNGVLELKLKKQK
ncbi:MAG: Hsp20/alpha crystallin family protein [Candidatus Thermoplasmatota archaeon]|nr:Hsp20/alpha crystallin family protein [Candidatus Thermoplasmatota archaeon]